MITAVEFVAALAGSGVTTMAGVPCSFLAPVINRAISDPGMRYLAATQEGEAVAVCAGAWLGGGLGCAFGQNSGLGNMINPLTSLMFPAEIPALLVITWRGQPGRKDEPQHELMGRITTDLLNLIEVGWLELQDGPAALPATIERCRGELDRLMRPFALVVAEGIISPEPLRAGTPPPRMQTVAPRDRDVTLPTRFAALECLLAELPEEAAVISTTGKTSRELYTISDRDQHLYLVGAMGSACAMGLGVALHTPRPVVVIDGDGSLLMRMGSLATVAAYGPDNLIHVVLDNGVYDSTGGQRSLSASMDFVATAAACGYAQVYRCGDLHDLAAAAHAALAIPGPALLHLSIQPGSRSDLGRPQITPAEVARRFRRFVTGRVDADCHASMEPS